jgi:cullin 3
MYSLFSREPPCLDYIRDCMFSLIKSIGSSIVQDKENVKTPKLFVQQILDLRNKYSEFVSSSFQFDRSFVKCLKDSLEYSMNLDSRCASYLSLYTDDMFKKRIKGQGENEIEQQLNNVISIFRYLHDKDIFEDVYKQHLSQRLLAGTTGNTEVEKLMIAKLKAECGKKQTIYEQKYTFVS